MIAGTASASAQAAQPAQAAQAAQTASTGTAAAFPAGTLFDGRVDRPTGGETPAELRIKFSVMNQEAPESYVVTPEEIAAALNELAVSRGWPPLTFYGTRPPRR
ncbi:hypothetical protein ACFQ3Z_04600 [Streptomyces nogalater]